MRLPDQRPQPAVVAEPLVGAVWQVAIEVEIFGAIGRIGQYQIHRARGPPVAKVAAVDAPVRTFARQPGFGGGLGTLAFGAAQLLVERRFRVAPIAIALLPLGVGHCLLTDWRASHRYLLS
jgi:hypothetical protein